MMCRDARIQRRAGCALGARGAAEAASDIPCPHAAFAHPCASQGLRAQRGDATVAIVASRRRHGAQGCPDTTAAA